MLLVLLLPACATQQPIPLAVPLLRRLLLHRCLRQCRLGEMRRRRQHPLLLLLLHWDRRQRHLLPLLLLLLWERRWWRWGRGDASKRLLVEGRLQGR